MKKTSNLKLRKASTAKKDEFYTQISDIERELKNEENFPFSTVNQRIIRKIPDVKNLIENMRSFL